MIRLPNVKVSDDAVITAISIQTDDATPCVFVSVTQGAKANLTPEVQLSWYGAAIIAPTKKIQLTIYGGAADDPTECTVTVVYRPVSTGGALS